MSVLEQKYMSLIKSANIRPVIAVVASDDDDVLKSLSIAKKEGLCDAILIGNKEKTVSILKELGEDVFSYEIINEDDLTECSKIAVSLARENKANMLMKGLIDTSIFLKAVVDRQNGLCSGRRLSHISLINLANSDKVFYVTDGGINIAPDLETKKHIVKNAVDAAHALGLSNPNVACLCAKEKVDPKMQCTLDAEELRKMNVNGEISGCVVSGPLAMDNAISIEAAKHKGITDPVAGYADILLMPNIEAGNITYKALSFLTKNPHVACIVSGASVPIALTSRADSHMTKLNSIKMALAVSIGSKK